MATHEQENILLKQALNALLETKRYKDSQGKDETYELMRRMAWRKAEDAIGVCAKAEPINENSGLHLQRVRLSLPDYDRLVELAVRGYDSAGEMEGVYFGLNQEEADEYELLAEKWRSNEA